MAKQENTNCIRCSVFNCPVARHSSEEWRYQASYRKITTEYEKGQLIIREDTEAFGIYIIFSGKAIITSDRENNRRHIIRLANEGDILEYLQMERKLMHPFSAEAITNCTICFIPKNLLSPMLRYDNRFAYHLERRYSKKFIEAEKRLRNALIMNSKAKVSDALLLISQAFDGQIPLLRREIGEMIGISAEQVSRELRKLADEDIIGFSGKHNEVVIKNKLMLLAIVDSYNGNNCSH